MASGGYVTTRTGYITIEFHAGPSCGSAFNLECSFAGSKGLGFCQQNKSH